jgi:bis(5'-nucleosidyl)-tetraphosphatase
MVKEHSAGAVIYRISEDGTYRFLLLQPAPGKPWGFPKGKLHRDENEEEAARREIAEETGLQSVELDATFRYVIHYLYRRGRLLVEKDVTYFLVRVDTSDVQLSWEHVAYRWATLEDSLDLVVFENARETLQRTYRHLTAAPEHAG